MTTHIYQAGTRLSNAYSLGRDGKPFAKHLGDTTSKAYDAWLGGHAEYLTGLNPSSLQYRIAQLQDVQKRNPMGSAPWQRASKALQPLFAEMARRQKAGQL